MDITPTEKDKAFRAMWTDRWAWPDEWSGRAIRDQESPYPRFSRWLNASAPREVSLGLLAKVLVPFMDDGRYGRTGPSLYEVRRAYDMAASRVAPVEAEKGIRGGRCADGRIPAPPDWVHRKLTELAERFRAQDARSTPAARRVREAQG